MKARIISNMTMDPLATALSPLDVTVGGYDSLILELLDRHALGTAEGEPTHVLAIFDTDTLFGDARFDGDAPNRALDFLRALDSFCARQPQTVVITHTFCAGPLRPENYAGLLGSDSTRALESAANDRLLKLARQYPQLIVFDLELIFRRHGEERLTSPSFWYAGRLRYTPLMFRELALTIRQVVAAAEHPSRKLLVLDLDNTLWGGIVGETGAMGITLSEQGLGAVYRDFQRSIKGLKNTGVLLAICSRNNAADVNEVFAKNPMMVLERDDFVAIRATWDQKPQIIAEIAQTLNLGLESVVFIDDNPVEREMVRAALPAVAVPDFPSKSKPCPSGSEDVAKPYFMRYRLTAEDLAKTEQYHRNEARKSLAGGFDLERFIEELNIVCNIEVDDPQSVVRASQMTQRRTNST